MILKTNFVFISCSYVKLKSSIKIEKITILEHRNNVSLSTLNQRPNLTLKQRWFWADPKKAILSIYHDFWKIKIFISILKRWPYFNVETTSVYQRWINVGIWRWNNVDFGVDSKKLLSFTIIQCLRTVTLNDICSDLIYLQTVVFSWYFISADILKFPGNDQRRRPFSVSCRFMKTFMRVFSFQ